MSWNSTYRNQAVPVQLVILCASVYGGWMLTHWLASWMHFETSVSAVQSWLQLPLNSGALLLQPWSFLTAPWAGAEGDLLSFIIKLVILYQFSNLVLTLRRGRAVWFLFIAGGAGGYLFAALLSMGIGFWVQFQGYIGGTGPAVMALAAAAATLMPEMPVRLFLFGEVRLKWIVAVYIALSLVSLGAPSLPTAAYIGGGALGWGYARAFRNGHYWEDFLPGWFSGRSGNVFTSRKNITQEKAAFPTDGPVSEAELDALLDKVSQKGYAALTRREKERLEQASRQNL